MDRRLWMRIGRLAKPCFPHLIAITTMSLLSAPIALLGPLPLKIAVDSVIGQRAMPAWAVHVFPSLWGNTRNSNLAIATALLLGIAALASIQSLISWLLQTYTGERLVHDFRAQLLWHTQRLGLSSHDRRGASDITYRIQYDAPAIQGLFIQGIVPLVTSTFSFAAMLVVTYQMSKRLAMISLVLSPVLALLARHSSHKVRTGYDELKELDSNAMLVLNEAISSVRAVKAFGQESYQDELFRRKSRLRMKEQLRLASVQASFHVIIGLCIAFGTAAALMVGVNEVQMKMLTVGDLLLAMAYMGQLYEPLRTISTRIPDLQGYMSSMSRAMALLEEAPEMEGSPTESKIDRVSGQVNFRNVSFQYTTGGRRVLNDISLDIPAGTRVGIVGPTGSGKSTLINLLTRFYDPTAGQIFIDGTDLRNFALTDLRRQFGIVMQDPALFSATVAANIAYGNPSASRSAVIEAAKMANAHEFIMKLPLAYETPIGEKGIRLSGGERQRLAIARAFLKNAPMIILDEPTSAVDIKTEAAIMQAIDSLLEGRTTFMIAHRLSTLEKCDVVLVLREGKLTMITNRIEEAREQLLQSHQTPEVLGPRLVQ